jgi:MoaA/NifB/PqqE/SkfB family radical SAM enzyme
MGGLDVYCLMGYQCNNSCLFCATGTDGKGLSTNEIMKFIDTNLCEGGHILFTGGEPTIRKDFPEIVKYTKDTYNARITILTNSTMFADSGFADNVCRYIDTAECSFYAHTPTVHDYVVQNPGSYNKTVTGIQALINHDVEVHVRTLINLRPTFRQLPDITEQIHDLFGVDKIWYSGLDLCGNLLAHPELVVKLQTAEYYLEKAIEVAEEHKMAPYLMFYPLCLLSPYHRALVIPETQRGTINSYISDQCNHHKGHGYDYAFGKRCSRCRKMNECYGVWSNYLAKYGENELSPIP